MATALTEAQRQRREVLETVVRNGLATFREVGTALMALRDQHLYPGDSFEDYIFETFGIRKSHGYRLIEAAQKVIEIQDSRGALKSPIGDDSAPRQSVKFVPENEYQARQLKGLKAEKLIRVWHRAEEIAAGKQPTIEHIRQARKDFGDAYEGRAEPRKERLPKQQIFVWDTFEEAFGRLVRELDNFAKERPLEARKPAYHETQQALSQIAERMKPYARGPSHQIYRGADGPAKWLSMLARSRSLTGQKTFRQAEALFARENNQQWPNRDWPGMPLRALDFYRLVRDVPTSQLGGSRG